MKYLFILLHKILLFTGDTIWLLLERVYKCTYKTVYFIWHLKLDISKPLKIYDGPFYSYRSLSDFYSDIPMMFKLECKICSKDCGETRSFKCSEVYTCKECSKSLKQK